MFCLFFLLLLSPQWIVPTYGGEGEDRTFYQLKWACKRCETTNQLSVYYYHYHEGNSEPVDWLYHDLITSDVIDKAFLPICQYWYNWCQYHDIAISLSLMKKPCFRDGLMGGAILDLARTSFAHDRSCCQGWFRREDIVFCWCLQWKSYFVDLFGNKVDQNRHIWHR